MNVFATKWIAAGLVLTSSIGVVGTVIAEDATATLNSVDSGVNNPAMQQAALAAELSILGDERKSPLLLLAAADLVGDLNPSSRDSSSVEKEGNSKDASRVLNNDLGYRDLLNRAEIMAKEQGESGKAILTHIQSLRSKGLVYRKATGKLDVVLEDSPYKFKVMDHGVIRGDGICTYRNLVFAGGKPAVVSVSGDGDGGLDLYVYDAKTEQLVGRHTGGGSRPKVSWTPLDEGAFTVVVKNVGGISKGYYLLCNW